VISLTDSWLLIDMVTVLYINWELLYMVLFV
jgi:hypothetical protein